MKRSITICSTFAGVEGLGMKIPNGELVAVSEWDRHASMVLKFHYPNVTNYGDISKIKWSELPDFDLLTGGSPCQDFSIAGTRRGLAGNKSSLAWEYVRALRDKKPKYFIWENVEGTLSSREGWDFANLLTAFSESGYSLWWQLLNAKYFGIAQNRSRIYVFGVRADVGSPKEIFFEQENDKEADHIQGQSSNTLTRRYFGAQGTGSYVIEGELNEAKIKTLNKPTHSSDRVYEESGISPALNTMRGGGRQPFVRVTKDGFHLARNDKKKSSIQGTHVTFEHGTSHALGTSHVPMVKIKEPTGKGIAQTIDRGMQQYTLTETDEIRRLMPIECERLMGWPDDWTRWGIDEKGNKVEISDSQRYSMCGNGAVPDLAEAIIKAHL